MPKEFTINYQTNTIVRISPYFLGILFSLIMSDYKSSEDDKKNRLLKLIAGNKVVQLVTHLIGLGVMVAMSFIIMPYLEIVGPLNLRSDAYTYLAFIGLSFLVGLILFLLPCCLSCDNVVTNLINNFLKLSIWNSLDKMTMGFLALGPVVIGFTTYSMQNSIYFDF